MPCFDHMCPGFVQVSTSVGIGGRIEPVSTYNGDQYEITVTISKVCFFLLKISKVCFA